MDPIVLFMLYRMLIVAGGIACIYFGYKLFYVAKAQQGDFKVKTGQNYEITLSDVAPGVFFALFGAGILVFCLVNGITIKSADLGGGSQFQTERSGTPVLVGKATEDTKTVDRTNAPSQRIHCMSQRQGEC